MPFAKSWEARCVSVPYNSGSDDSVAAAAALVKDSLAKLRATSGDSDPNNR